MHGVQVVDVYPTKPQVFGLCGSVLAAMSDRIIEVPDAGDDPVPPLRRKPALLDGIARCADCGELMLGDVDARGVEYYTHENEIEPEDDDADS